MGGSGTKASGGESVRQLGKLYQKTGESRYRLAQLEMRMYGGENPSAVVQEIEALAKQPDVNSQQLQDLWRRAVDRLPNTAANMPRVRAFLQRYPADQAMVDRLAAMQQAVERAERAARDPANIARNAARVALDQGNTERAEEQLQTVLALRPGDGESLGNLGMIRLRQGQHAQAQDLFGQAFALTRQGKWKDLQATARFWGFLRQADVALEKSELATAADLAGRALAMQPNNAEALTTLASIRDLQGDRTQAEALYQSALKAEANSSSALKGLAGLYARTGRTGEALVLLEKASASDAALGEKLVGTQADILVAQADEHMQAQRLSAAMRTLESAIVLTPGDAWLRHRLARLYLRLNLPREALSVMDEGIARATTASADRSAMHYARALIRSAVDNDPGALADLAQIPAAEQTDSMRALAQRSTVKSLVAQAGASRNAAEAQALLDMGARRVLISAPGGDDVDTTIVMGVNEDALKAGMTVVSNASCTTNCLAPVAKILADSVGIKQGLMTTIHAYTNDQVTVDVRHKDLRRARAAAANIIPTKTGAAKAVGLVLPQLVGKVDGFALRVPTINVSLVDLTFTAERATTKEEINELMTAAAKGPLKGILDVNTEPLVSSDFNHTTVSSTFDATQTRVIKAEDGSVLVKVLAWYDNEWGYSCRMLDAARAFVNAK